MNTNHHTEPIHITLNDGNMQLAEWNQSLAPVPTIGESIEIPKAIKADLQGYEPSATVSKITHGTTGIRLHLEANCHLAHLQRTAITLNSSRIPQPQRASIEAYLRNIYRLPIIDWEPRCKSEPILRFHEPATGRKTILPTLQEKIRSLIPDPILI